MDDTNELYILNIAQRLRKFNLGMLRAIYMVVEQMEQLLEAGMKENGNNAGSGLPGRKKGG